VTNRCNWCEGIDELVHYFYECPKIGTFWNSYEKWWENMMGDVIPITKKLVMLGMTTKYNKKQTFNACVITAKWHIYKSKLDQSLPFFYKFICDLKYNLMVEKMIAIKNNKMHLYEQTWQPVENYIT
jgi:hypothetical protein